MRVVAMLGVVDPLDLEPAALQLRDQPRRPLRMLIEDTDLHNSPLLDRIWVLEQTRPALARGTACARRASVPASGCSIWRRGPVRALMGRRWSARVARSW